MNRLSRIAATILAGAAVAPAALAVPAAANASASAAPSRARLTGLACRSPLAPADRAVSIETVMRPVTGSRTLSLRLTLLQREPDGAGWHTVPATGDLGVWLTPADPTLGRRPGDVWKLAKSVYDVGAPSRYRFSVQFRWLGASGAVLRRATLRSATCAVRDPRPDLVVRGVSLRAVGTRRRRDRYVAVIANRGGTVSGAFLVQFTPTAGAAPVDRRVGSLAPRGRARVSFTGPLCDAAAPPVIVADPRDRVDDADRADNTATVSCPAG